MLEMDTRPPEESRELHKDFMTISRLTRPLLEIDSKHKGGKIRSLGTWLAVGLHYTALQDTTMSLRKEATEMLSNFFLNEGTSIIMILWSCP
jgi:hypothetical protein